MRMGGFFQLRYMMALVVAISIDALIFLLGVAIAAIFFHPATAGAFFGCVITEAWLVKNGCWLGGLVGAAIGAAGSFLPIVGPALMATVEAMGAGLAAVVDFCIAVTWGSGLVFLMFFMGMLPTMKMRGEAVAFLIAKMIPGINLVPGYTVMVMRNIMVNEAQNLGNALGGVAKIAAAAASGSAISAMSAVGSTMTGRVGGVAHGNEERPRTRMPLVEGIVDPNFSPQRTTPRQLAPLWQVANDTLPVSAQTTRDINAASMQRMAKAA